MNIISFMILGSLLFSLPYALYIDYCRSGRKSNGQFIGKAKKQLFYSELTGGVR